MRKELRLAGAEGPEEGITHRGRTHHFGEQTPYVSTETVLYAQTLGFKPITTPAYSPESNGMAEAFVNTIKRDYVGGANLSDAQTVIRQIPAWLEDYNRFAPHSALGFLSPKDFHAQQYIEVRTLRV
jgi:transposase InsO family protein